MAKKTEDRGCELCTGYPSKDFCKGCVRSYDRWHASKNNDGSIYSGLAWASRRARGALLRATLSVIKELARHATSDPNP